MESNQLQINRRINFRCPQVFDGARVTALIEQCPPLDVNSAYCNLLQCTHFAQTCIVAESNNDIFGWISAYRPPDQLDRLFIWQVAVHPDARGQGLAKQMLHHLLARQVLKNVTHLSTTITQNNHASWRLFKGFASQHDLKLAESPHFEKVSHFNGLHDTEFLVEIGPFDIHAIQN